MRITPSDWTVTIIGQWNPAILTPAWIRGNLFQLDENTPVELFVALDEMVPVKVRHDGITVQASTGRLLVEVAASDYRRLARAMDIGRRALDGLPRTPFFAAGINIIHEIVDPSPEVMDLFQLPLDLRISDAGYQASGWTVSRAVAFRDGRLNLIAEMSEQADRIKLICNFDCKTKEMESLRNWLSIEADDIENEVKKVLEDVFRLDMEAAHAG